MVFFVPGGRLFFSSPSLPLFCSHAHTPKPSTPARRRPPANPPPPPPPPPPPVTVADNLIEKEDLVSLDNGCVCCSLRKDVVRALMTIARRAEQRGRAPDHVVLETTGLADPAPVAFTFLSNPWVAARFVVDAIM